MASTCMPGMNGVAGSRMGQACATNSCSLLFAFSFFTSRWLSAGLLEDRIELLELLVGEFAIVKLLISGLVDQMQGLGLRGKSSAKFLNRPRFFATSSLPE